MAKTNGNGHKIGPSIILKVMAGDKFNLRVSSWYRKNGSNPGNPQSIAADLIAGLIGSLTGTGGPVHGAVTPAQLQDNSVIPLAVTGVLNNQPAPGSSKPKAYLNWVLLDEQFKFVQSGSGAEQVGNDQELKIHTKTNLHVPKNGYLYVFVSNETPNIDVYWDNLQITHVRGPLVEETHYYPFGLTMAGISSKALNGTPENKFKYNGIEYNEDFDLNTYDAIFRTLDAQIGRWWSLDPKPNVSISGYTSMANNPVRFADPFGDTATVRWGTGFLGLRRHEARYVDGQWIDSKSRNAVDINDVKRSGARRIMNDYKTLNGIEDFNPVTDAVNTATNDVRLSWNGGSKTDVPRYFRDLIKRGIANPTIRVSASSSASLPEELYQNWDNSSMPSYMILGHELGHAWDLLRSGRNPANFIHIKELADGITYSEVNAMYWENVLRLNAGMPLRLWYHYNKSLTPQFQLKANVSYSRERVMIGEVPYFKLITTVSDLLHTNSFSR